MDAHTKGLFLGFGLVVFSLIAAIVVKQFQSGSRAFSHLDKAVEVPFDSLNLEFHKKFFRERLATLGFKPAGNDSDFIQGGTDLGEFGPGAHAKTKKILSLAFRDTGPDKSVAIIKLRYANVVGVDEGEGAYADAVLAFVSGAKDDMANIPRDSILAMDSLIGGIVACLVVIVLMVSDKLSLWVAIRGLAVTEIAIGLVAIYTIFRRPLLITGRWKALAGVALSLAALCVGILFIIAVHSGKAL